MKKWAIPLTVGIGGLGAMLLSERGRKLIRSTVKPSPAKSGRLVAWDTSAQQELFHIQEAVKDLEHSLGTHTAR